MMMVLVIVVNVTVSRPIIVPLHIIINPLYRLTFFGDILQLSIEYYS